MTHGAQIDWTAFERATTALLASKLELAVDTQIFRGGIPQGVETGVGVLANTLATLPYYGVAHPSFDVQVLGRFRTRDEASAMLSKLYAMNIERGTVHGVKQDIKILARQFLVRVVNRRMVLRRRLACFDSHSICRADSVLMCYEKNMRMEQLVYYA